jgi:hypothetical protein
MNTNILRAAVLALAALGLAACDDDDDGSGAPGVDRGPFEFRNELATRYSRVDRMGQPATATVLIDSSTPAPGAPGNPANPNANLRDAFNRADPATDAAVFGGGFVERLKLIHFELAGNGSPPQAGSLRDLGLIPCSTPGATPAETNIDICLAQAASVVLPDVITLDPNQAVPDSWPNGRFFDDPVVDRLVAAALLNISVPADAPPHNLNTLASLPLNPAVTEADGTIPRNGNGLYLPPTRLVVFPYLRAKNP